MLGETGRACRVIGVDIDLAERKRMLDRWHD